MRMFGQLTLKVAAVAATLMAGSAVAQAADITGAGATFPYPIYAKWAEAYKAATGTGLNYQSIGSGGGIQQIKAATVTFGASDMPMKPEDLKAAGLVQWPMIMGGVVPVVNLPGIKPGELVLDGATMAKIYLGEITAWNDPAIKALNPSVTLPDTAIAVVHRSDGSGTSFLFTTFLSQDLAEWKDKVGAATAVEWPVGIGAKGNEGVAGTAGTTAGSIGYVEYAYAKQNNLTFTRLRNADGKVVSPDLSTFQAAAAGADWSKAPDFQLILTNQPGATSWPITGASFIIMYKEPKDPAAAAEALKFFDWAYAKGDDAAKALDYVPMPDAVVNQVHQYWTANIQSGGKPVFAATH